MILSETHLPEAMPLAERCRHAVCVQPFETAAGSIHVTVSIGAAELNIDQQRITRTELLELAINNCTEPRSPVVTRFARDVC